MGMEVSYTIEKLGWRVPSQPLSAQHLHRLRAPWSKMVKNKVMDTPSQQPIVHQPMVKKINSHLSVHETRDSATGGAGGLVSRPVYGGLFVGIEFRSNRNHLQDFG